MTNPDALAAVVGRCNALLGEDEVVPVHTTFDPLSEVIISAADLHTLLAALAEARNEREEIVFYLMSASTLSAARAHVGRILARRTPQPETPE